MIRPGSSRSQLNVCSHRARDRFAIFEADWDRYRLRARVLAGGELEGLNKMEISMDRGITGGLLRGYPYNCSDTRSHSEAVSIPDRTSRP